MKARQVAVIGSGPGRVAEAEEVGRLLAERGCTVVTGGLGEVMAAAHRGAKAAGGTTIAILPGEAHGEANPWADHVVVTGIGHARTSRWRRPVMQSSPWAAATGRSPRSASHSGSDARSCSSATGRPWRA